MDDFKAQLEAELDSVFFNDDEFAEKHRINGREMSVIVDNDLLGIRKMNYSEGSYTGDLLFFVMESVYGTHPVIEEVMDFDGSLYRVTDVGTEDGMYVITLEMNR